MKVLDKRTGNWRLGVSLVACVLLMASVAHGQYCSASGGCTGSGGTLHIGSVVVGSINNSSGCSGYGDYTAMSTTMQIGQSYPITVTNGDSYNAGDQCGIWVDWNGDGDFSDAGETVSVSGGPVTFTASISPPSGAAIGPTRMRIRIRWTGALSPCGDTPYGEVEDYTINVTTYVPPGYGGGSGCGGAGCNMRRDNHRLLCDCDRFGNGGMGADRWFGRSR